MKIIINKNNTIDTNKLVSISNEARYYELQCDLKLLQTKVFKNTLFIFTKNKERKIESNSYTQIINIIIEDKDNLEDLEKLKLQLTKSEYCLNNILVFKRGIKKEYIDIINSFSNIKKPTIIK